MLYAALHVIKKTLDMLQKIQRELPGAILGVKSCHKGGKHSKKVKFSMLSSNEFWVETLRFNVTDNVETT